MQIQGLNMGDIPSKLEKINLGHDKLIPEPGSLSRTRPGTRESRFSNPDPAQNPEFRAGSSRPGKTRPLADPRALQLYWTEVTCY